ncbi:MAG: GNAT family N-acetyltransferase [Rhodospirillales bacterium]
MAGIVQSGLDRPLVFAKDTLVCGKPASIQCYELFGQHYTKSGTFFTTLRLEDEWYEDVADPERLIGALKRDGQIDADLFTFWQRIPDARPVHDYYHELEEIAVLPVTTYKDWWNKQIKSRVRNMIRKAERQGVEVRETEYDDPFIKGMTTIFNESPTRQGRQFWHYGKDFDTVKSQFSRYVYRERMVGAYFEGELIGFMMLGDAGRYCLTGQVLSSLKHRDKNTSNLLIAKAVEICEQRGFPYLVYFFWGDDSLSEFKRRCGFEGVKVPRYYVPLSWKGELALRFGAHRGWKALVPPRLKDSLKRVRSSWYERRGGCRASRG